MEKDLRCFGLTYRNGKYYAMVGGNDKYGYFHKEVQFLFYTKKQVIHELRHGWNCVVPREVCNGYTREISH